MLSSGTVIPGSADDDTIERLRTYREMETAGLLKCEERILEIGVERLRSYNCLPGPNGREFFAAEGDNRRLSFLAEYFFSVGDELTIETHLDRATVKIPLNFHPSPIYKNHERLLNRVAEWLPPPNITDRTFKLQAVTLGQHEGIAEIRRTKESWQLATFELDIAKRLF
jgi:hypothetical protein